MSVRHFPGPSAAPWPTAVICTNGPYSLGALVTGASQAYPTANKAYLYPFVVAETLIAYKLGWVNGTSPTGNADIGIYDAAGNRLVSGGGTARSGASTTQVVDITDTPLAPHTLYYLAYAQDDTSGTRMFQLVSQIAAFIGVREKATSYVLPSTITGTTACGTANMVDCFIEARARA